MPGEFESTPLLRGGIKQLWTLTVPLPELHLSPNVMFSSSAAYCRWASTRVSLIVSEAVSLSSSRRSHFSVTPRCCSSCCADYVEGLCPVQLTSVPPEGFGQIYQECVTVHVWMTSAGRESNLSPPKSILLSYINLPYHYFHLLYLIQCFPQTCAKRQRLKSLSHRLHKHFGLSLKRLDFFLFTPAPRLSICIKRHYECTGSDTEVDYSGIVLLPLLFLT